jgi:hypothetical protein
MSARAQESWLKAMYRYTALGAGVPGLLMMTMPEGLALLLGMPRPEPVIFGIVACSYVAFGLLAVLGLRSPQRFVPILLLQLSYKTLWLVTVFLPLWLQGQATPYSWLFAVIFSSYVIGDLIAIPFRSLWAGEAAG